MDLHIALGLCKFVEKKPDTIINLDETYSADEEDLNPRHNILHGSVAINPDSGKPDFMIEKKKQQIEYFEFDKNDEDIIDIQEDIKEQCESSDEKDSNLKQGTSNFEQLPIDINISGLKEILH